MHQKAFALFGIFRLRNVNVLKIARIGDTYSLILFFRILQSTFLNRFRFRLFPNRSILLLLPYLVCLKKIPALHLCSTLQKSAFSTLFLIWLEVRCRFPISHLTMGFQLLLNLIKFSDKIIIFPQVNTVNRRQFEKIIQMYRIHLKFPPCWINIVPKPGWL